MDISTLMKIATSRTSATAISKQTKASSDDVTKVLAQVMPALLGGASAQATGKSTAESFAKAIADHGTRDTKDLTKFLSNVDVADGAKIVSHLLGGNTRAVSKTVSKSTGVSEKDVAQVMSLAAPLMMSILGQQKAKHSDGSSALLQAVMSGVANSGITGGDVVNLLGKFMKK